MNKIKLSMQKLFSKNPLEKEIYEIESIEKPQPVKEEQLQIFFDGINEKYKGFGVEKVSEALINALQHSQNWVQAMQFIFIMQKITTLHGRDFTIATMHNIHLNPIDLHTVLAKHSSKLDNVLHVPIVVAYYNYLQGLFQVQDFRLMCREVLRQKQLDLILKMPFDQLCQQIYLTLENIRHFLISAGFLIQQSIFKVKDNKLMKQVGANLLSDMIAQYNCNSSIVQILTDDLLNISDNEALKLYKLYEEIIIITKELKKFYELKDYLEVPFIQSPHYFNFELEKNKKIEHHVHNLQLKSQNPEYSQEMNQSHQNERIRDINKINQKFQQIMRSKSVLAPGSTLQENLHPRQQNQDQNMKGSPKRSPKRSPRRKVKPQTLSIRNKQNNQPYTDTNEIKLFGRKKDTNIFNNLLDIQKESSSSMNEQDDKKQQDEEDSIDNDSVKRKYLDESQEDKQEQNVLNTDNEGAVDKIESNDKNGKRALLEEQNKQNKRLVK